MTTFRRLEERFPAGIVSAKLFRGQNEVAELEYRGGMTSNSALLLVSDKLTTDLAFDRVVISTKVQIKNARVTWINYSK